MTCFSRSYNCLFLGFLLSVLIVFFSSRELNSPWHRFIAGDGFGYYAYLPAKFIYADTNYEFKWFNKVYDKYYAVKTNSSADENFLVKYKDRKINKYYQGLSLLWLPFFAIAHLSAVFFDYPTDGFSLPYQLAIGFASLFYLFMGLFYLRKLLLKMYAEPFMAVLVPIMLYYGTYLFLYARDYNSLTHVYSFALIVMLAYFSRRFFYEGRVLLDLLKVILLMVVIICIRPLNVLSFLLIPVFAPANALRGGLRLQPFKITHILVLLLIPAFLLHQFGILYAQTGTFFPDTYNEERFNFLNPRLFDVLFSYHAGLFVYVPLIFLSMSGIVFLKRVREKILLPAIFFLLVYVYSSWWYWPITTRSLIDFYVIPAIFIGALLHAVKGKGLKVALIVCLLLLTAYYQLKGFQMRQGILDANLTHSELFWKNFFRTTKANIYAIPPSAIIKKIEYKENFDGKATGHPLLKEFGDSQVAVLDSNNVFSSNFAYPIPEFFKEEGIKKIRFSFRCYFEKDIELLQMYLYLYDKGNNEVHVEAYYIVKATMQFDKWDYKEFGFEMGEKDLERSGVDHVKFVIWNSRAKDAVFIDDVKTEFILLDKRFEVAP
jgi:hypothetical protein